MLNNEFFYNRTIRKVVVTFGTLFKDIDIVRIKEDGSYHERFRVPLSYGEKEKYLTRITSDPNLTKSIATHVPRISFNLESLSYDPTRKQVSTLRNFSVGQNGRINSQYTPVPYNFEFNLSVYVRNTEDGTQILEQILPFFTPDFTITVDFNPDMSQKYDIPIILNSVTSTVDYEGDFLTTRLIIWDLSFTVKGYIWPAIKKSTSGIIGAVINPDINGAGNAGPGGGIPDANNFGKIIINTYTETQTKEAQVVYVDYANGSNYFVDHEVIRVPGKITTGRISYFSNTSSGKVILTDLNQLVSANDYIVGDYSNAKYLVTDIENEPTKMITLITRANPIDAAFDSDFGFTEVWQ